MRLWQAIHDFLYDLEKRSMREKSAFKVGRIDRRMNHHINRFKEGTEAHRLWQKGYKDEENREMTIW